MEQHSQPLARSFDSHFQGGDTDTGDQRHVFVSKVFNVFQQEGFPLIRVQPLQGAFQLFAPGSSFGGMVLGGSVKGDVIADKGPLTSTASGSGSPAAIGQDAEEPGREALGIITLGQRSIGTDEGILQRFLRILTATEHPYRITTVLSPVSRYDHGVSLGLSTQYARHDRGIAVVLYRETPRLRHPST
jgi:hypothetical protein